MLAHDAVGDSEEERFVVLPPALEAPEFAGRFQRGRRDEDLGGDIAFGGRDVEDGWCVLGVLKIGDARDVVVGEAVREEAVGAGGSVFDEGGEAVAGCGFRSLAGKPAGRETQVVGRAAEDCLQQLQIHQRAVKEEGVAAQFPPVLWCSSCG